MVLAGLIAALKLVGGALADHTFLFLGAGEVGLDPYVLCHIKIKSLQDMFIPLLRMTFVIPMCIMVCSFLFVFYVLNILSFGFEGWNWYS